MYAPIEAAKEIRKTLKAKFPKNKFRVSTSRYSMGSSIYVYCQKELIEDVKAATYQFGMDKGCNMDDSRIINRVENVPQATFVFVQGE